MILFFGTRPGKKVTQVLQHVACPYCEQTGTLTVVSQPHYAHVFWIPLFSLATSCFATCSHCKRVYYKKEFTPDMKQALST